MFDLRIIDKSWTLFLDRDGVINKEKADDYVYDYDEFIFYDGVTDALKTATEKFGRLVVTTNQRGVGRRLMTEAALGEIHRRMVADVAAAGGLISKVYYCTAIDNADPCRKPNPGMALEAQKDFPEIDFTRSVMIGNNISDMEFGRNAGMHTIFLTTTHPDKAAKHPDAIDLVFDSLSSFAKALHF
jgi:D-glycero-D-manno-heptose 1,7-bisphosphate phosphatase